MSFSTIPFVFLFLPVSLLLYYLCPGRLRLGLLVLLSLLFYAWGDVKSLPVLAFSVLFNYLTGLEIRSWRAQGDESVAGAAFWVSAVVNVLVLCYYKYLAGSLPLGLSFYTFSALSYIADIYRGRAPGETNLFRAAAYIAFFPKLISGPIARYEEFAPQLREPPVVSRDDLYAGAEQFLAGLFKKVLLADRLGTAFAAVQGLGAMSAASAWLGMIFYSLQLFFDFAGYSDMAIGLGRMLGFQMEKNFDYPYMSLSISEFWRRWHISLGAWFREYVYIPLGGNRKGQARLLMNLLVVWVLTGLWHGSGLNFLVWGLWHGLFVILERFVIRDRLDGFPRVLRTLTTCLIVFFGWVLFFSPSLGGALSYFSAMFGGDGLGLWDGAAAYLLRNNLLLLLASALFCTPMMKNLRDNLIAKVPGGAGLSALVSAALLAFAAAGMVNATYAAFLYFQF